LDVCKNVFRPGYGKNDNCTEQILVIIQRKDQLIAIGLGWRLRKGNLFGCPFEERGRTLPRGFGWGTLSFEEIKKLADLAR
tara:strand:+ start:15289 stop:15531 length:243 start_codon:yes stop_codon:yes gene_type:complete